MDQGSSRGQAMMEAAALSPVLGLGFPPPEAERAPFRVDGVA